MSSKFVDFINPRTGRVVHLLEGSKRYEQAIRESWERVDRAKLKEIRRSKVKEKIYRGHKGWRVVGGWKTELTDEEVFPTWNKAARAMEAVLFDRSKAEADTVYAEEAKALYGETTAVSQKQETKPVRAQKKKSKRKRKLSRARRPPSA